MIKIGNIDVFDIRVILMQRHLHREKGTFRSGQGKKGLFLEYTQIRTS